MNKITWAQLDDAIRRAIQDAVSMRRRNDVNRRGKRFSPEAGE